MNREKLKKLVAVKGIRADAYSLEGGFPSERYVLAVVPDGWAVYYSERGERTDLKVFDTEDEACAYLFEVLIKDRTTR